MAAAAIPAAIKVGSMVGGSLLGRMAAKPSRQASTAMQGTTAAATGLDKTGADLTTAGMPLVGQAGDYLSQAGNYYGRILKGDRASMTAAVAPEQQQALEYFRGGAANIDRTMKGGSRDYAKAELDRTRVATLANIRAGARPMAAQGAERVAGAYGNIGSSLMGQGVQARTNAGYLQNTAYGQQQQDAGARETGKGFGGMLFDILQAMPWGKGGSAMPSIYRATPSLPVGGNLR